MYVDDSQNNSESLLVLRASKNKKAPQLLYLPGRKLWPGDPTVVGAAKVPT